eukprot:412988-Amphidinium_carterae.1
MGEEDAWTEDDGAAEEEVGELEFEQVAVEVEPEEVAVEVPRTNQQQMGRFFVALCLVYGNPSQRMLANVKSLHA